MRLNGIDSLQRGIINLLANWELVIVHLVQTFVVTLLVVAGAVPIILVIGVGTLRAFMGTGLDGAGPGLEELEGLAARMAESIGPLVLATLVAAIVWTIALLVLAYFQAGIQGVLAGGDRKAPHPTAARKGFRGFSLAEFRRCAEAFTWRFFWLMNLFMALASLPLLVFGAVAVLAGWLVMRESIGAAIATGCLGAIVVIVLSVVCSLWWQLAMAAAVAGPSGVWQAIGQGLRVLLRRLGAVLVLVLLAMVVGITAAIVLVPLGIVAEVIMRDSLWGYVSSQIVMTIVQSVFSAVVTIVFAGALIALVRGEISTEEGRTA